MKTIQDVARRAGVGAATVSRVINGTGYVKEDTRERIQKAIEELDYTPNEMARNLFHRKSHIVAILMPEVSYPYYAEFINAAEIALYNQGYQTMICTTGKEKNYEAHYLDLLKQQRVDGIITGVHTLKTEKYDLIDGPIVALDRELNARIPCVSVNHWEGGRLAAEELIRAGCRNVLQCIGVRSASTPFNERHWVFEKIMQEHGITCHNYEMKWNTFTPSYYSREAELITEKYPDVDGFFATDITALSIIKSAASRGKRYPRDYKVIAYDGTYASNLIYPTLTAIVQPIGQLAEKCVEVLMNLIEGKPLKQKNYMLDVELKRGDSTQNF